MNRRDLIKLVGVASAWPFAARSQQAPLPVVAFLNSYSLEAGGPGQRRLAVLQQGLADAGFVEGQNVAIEAKWAEGHYDRLHAMATDLVHRQVSVIVAGSTPAALVAKAATTTIPVVFSVAGDPVAVGLVPNLARPGGNVTGVTRLVVELVPKKIDLLRQIVPGVTSMAVMINPANRALSGPDRKEAERTARNLGLELHVLEASDGQGIDAAYNTMVRLRVGALLISNDAYYLNQSAQFAALSLRHRIPTIYSYRPFVAAGGLMSYAGSDLETYRIAGEYAGRILKGEKPADLPVQQASKIEMFINLKTASALGLTIPAGILVLADEVIE